MATLVWLESDCIGEGSLPDYRVYRTPVPGGWLVATSREERQLYTKDFQPSTGVTAPGEMPLFVLAFAGSLTFVPDPEHLWDGSSVIATPVVRLPPPVIQPHTPSITKAEAVRDQRTRFMTWNILIQGEDLNYSPTVWFGDMQATVLSISPQSLTIEVPSGVSQGRVIVATAYGTAATREPVVIPGGPN